MSIDLLVFGPHPDDIEIGLGGTVARHTAAGHQVGLCDLTKGELSSNGTPEQRQAEAAAAAGVLGALWRENLGWPDGGIQATPPMIRAAVDVIRHGRERTIDLGSARWGPLTPDPASPDRQGVFVVGCGMGLDARIMAAAQHEWKRRMRFGAYVGAAIGELARLSTAVFQITADGNELEIRGYLVLVANTGDIIPGRVGPRRPLDPADGHLQLMVLGANHPLDGLRSAAALLLSRDELDGRVIRRSVNEVRVEADPVQPIQVDGDDEPAGWLEAQVSPGALTVLAPAD